VIVEKFWMTLPETDFDRNGKLPRDQAPRFVFIGMDLAEADAEQTAILNEMPVYVLQATRAFIPTLYSRDGRIVASPHWVDLQLPGKE
jgi:hypothetical protein